MEEFRAEEAAKAAAEAARIAAEAEAVRQAQEAAARAYVAPTPVYGQIIYQSYQSSVGTLTGSYGYARAGGNCVNEPGVNNPGYGNPSDWPATSSEPWIGATFMFWGNHTGVVTGLWSNGDIEVRHQNYYGGQHRFPRSMFRGFR